MDAVHIHLLLNHFPIVGTLIGAAVMLWGLLRGQNTVKAVAAVIIFAMAIMAAPVYLTGEPAEERVEHLPGVSESFIEEHEEAAETAIIVMALAGIASLVALIVQYRKGSNIPFIIAAILTIFAFLLMARTGYYGGQIRHSELRSDQGTTTVPSAEYDEDDDD